MQRSNRTFLVFGVLLILAGVLLLLARNNPDWQAWINEVWAWPLGFVAIGGIFLLMGLILGEPGMCIPAAILAGLGGIFYYQYQTGDWASWTYMWALIPGFVGVGIILAALLEGRLRSVWSGLDLILISGVLYLIFASFFGGITLLGSYGPAILMISLGIYVLIRGAMAARKKQISG
jgi:hypothetical protein